MNVFYKELEKYDINWRTAGSLYEIFKKNPEFINISDNEIFESYKKWLNEFWYYNTEIQNNRILIVIKFIKNIFKNNIKLPKNTYLDTPWGEEYISIYKKINKGEDIISASAIVNKELNIEKLLKAYELISKGDIKVYLGGYICPVCGTCVEFNDECYKCKSSIPYEEICKRAVLLPNKELQKYPKYEN